MGMSFEICKFWIYQYEFREIDELILFYLFYINEKLIIWFEQSIDEIINVWKYTILK